MNIKFVSIYSYNFLFCFDKNFKSKNVNILYYI